MKVLVACERSGIVRRAFERRGHDAWSCDLLPAEDGSNRHIVGDAQPAKPRHQRIGGQAKRHHFIR